MLKHFCFPARGMFPACTSAQRSGLKAVMHSEHGLGSGAAQAPQAKAVLAYAVKPVLDVACKKKRVTRISPPILPSYNLFEMVM